MLAGRRVLLCSAFFLGLALLLAGGTARAQELWKSNLTPDQLKAALAKMAAGEGTDGDAFQNQILDMMRKQHPNFSKDDIEKALKILKDHPELLDQAKKLAKDKQMQPGRPGQLSQEDLAKLFQTKPGGELPDPKDFNIGKEPPQPGNTEPPQPGKIEPPQPGKIEPPQPGANANPANPMNPGEQPKTQVDPNDFPTQGESDPRTKSMEAFKSIWEQTMGSLDDTPEVKQALFDLVSGEGFDFDIKDENGNSFWDFLKGDGKGSSFGDMFNGAGSGSGDWGMGDWHFPNLGNWFGGGSSSSSSSSWFGSGSSSPRPSSGGWGSGGGGWGIGGLGGAWVPFAILLLIIIAVVIWFQVKNMQRRVPALAIATEGLGAWPIDPRRINTRQDVVLAFEYLSVLICGPSAKNWTHGTIAEALTDLAATHGETAVMLARLYELARYAPLDEPLSHAELIEARKLVCTLAGVAY